MTHSNILPTAVVVNDDSTQLNVLCALLQKAGLEPIPFKSAETALSAMSQDSPPALIITDIYMPGIDGWRFCRLLRSAEYARFNHTPILVVSATFSGEEPSRITSDLGANAFLPMPVDRQQLIKTVQALLKGEKSLDALKALVVEPSHQFSGRLLEAFQAHGYRADAASTYQESVTRIGQTLYDVAVLDYHLPDGLGDGVLKVLLQKSPDCVCMMTTADPHPDLALTWMKQGAAATLQKPFEPEYLILQCERARRERSLLRVQDLLEVRTRQLQVSEARFSSVMDATSDGLWDWDVPSGKVYYSPAYFTMLGYSSGEFPGTLTTFLDLLHPDDRNAVLAANEENRNMTDAIYTEYRMRAKDGSFHWILSRGHVLSRDANGQALRMVGTHVDITERKRLEAALESRLVALTRPLDQPQGIEFKDLFNLETIQTLQDEFANATGVASIITHPDGTPITRPSNFCRLCSAIIRKTEKGQINCFNSDAEIGRFHPEGPILQTCLSGGLWDAGAGISVGGRHIANWLIGQVRDETQSEANMRDYARKIGADETAVVEAFREVPAMSQVQFQRVAQVLFTMANQLSTSAYQNVQQARFITERKQAEDKMNDQLEELRRWHNITLGREDRILELKREVNKLLAEVGKPPHYPSAVKVDDG